MGRWEMLLEILQASLDKNGDKPLSIGHLINIMKMVDRKFEEMDEEWDVENDDWRWK
jgi:hypothetical protein